MLSKVIGGVILTSREEVVKIRPELNGLIVEREQILKFKKYLLPTEHKKAVNNDFLVDIIVLLWVLL